MSFLSFGRPSAPAQSPAARPRRIHRPPPPAPAAPSRSGRPARPPGPAACRRSAPPRFPRAQPSRSRRVDIVPRRAAPRPESRVRSAPSESRRALPPPPEPAGCGCDANLRTCNKARSAENSVAGAEARTGAGIGVHKAHHAPAAAPPRLPIVAQNLVAAPPYFSVESPSRRLSRGFASRRRIGYSHRVGKTPPDATRAPLSRTLAPAGGTQSVGCDEPRY